MSLKQPEFLPISRNELKELGWHEADVIIITGDAYADHPSFGAALLGRYLVSRGYRTAIIPQPDWNNIEQFRQLGKPELCFAITSGNMDSMVNHYTSFRCLRSLDSFSPDQKMGMRPNRAVLVYADMARAAYRDSIIILGGIESSMRRFVHYDYWADRIRRSILADSKADILIYGMAEKAFVKVLDRIEKKADLYGINGTCIMMERERKLEKFREIPSYESIINDKSLLLKATKEAEEIVNSIPSMTIVQMHGNKRLVHYPPSEQLSIKEFDALYELPYSRGSHPFYKDGIHALESVQNSITVVRGCGGACTFCSLSFHQGKRIVSRSIESVLRETHAIKKNRNFKGHIKDLGGATANLYGVKCSNDFSCNKVSCLFPTKCVHLEIEDSRLLDLWREVGKVKGIKHLTIGSGFRYELLSEEVLEVLIRDHVSGQLKIAPEHVSENVLKLMRKPSIAELLKFMEKLENFKKKLNKEVFLVPYFISGFPGCSLENMKEIESFFKKFKWHPEQVQAFLPSPGTIATGMYLAEKDYRNNKRIYVAKKDGEKRRQFNVLLGRHAKTFPLT
ncbi:MAG: YgiQ family radical SAM protein [Candidatus Coatesbacteria bacterium]|nr:YgiQ family radical SAM protein [Candidatus Coatesbacteria bacterium]